MDNIGDFLKLYRNNLTLKPDKGLTFEYRDREKISTENRLEFAVGILEKMIEELFSKDSK